MKPIPLSPRWIASLAHGLWLMLVLLLLAPHQQTRAEDDAAPLPPHAQEALGAARLRLEEPHPPQRPRPMQQHEGSLPLSLFEGAWRGYKIILSPHTGATCAFSPSCSRFGLDAVTRFGPLRGVLLTLDRLQRDHPYAYKYHAHDPDTGLLIDPVEAWCGATGHPCP